MKPFDIPSLSVCSAFSCSYLEPAMLAAIRKGSLFSASQDLPPLSAQYRASALAEGSLKRVRRHSLLLTLIAEAGLPFYFLVALKLFLVLLALLKPVMLRWFIQMFESDDASLASEGARLILGIAGCRLLELAAQTLVWQISPSCVRRAESLLVTYIVEKVSRVPAWKLPFDLPTVTMLVSRTHATAAMLYRLNDFWRCPLLLAAGTYQLASELGNFPAVFSLAASALGLYMGSRFSQRISDHVDRIQALEADFSKVVNECLAGVKAIKLNCWEGFMADRVGKVRENLLDARTRMGLVSQLADAQKELFGQAVVALGIVLFSTWGGCGELTASKVFMTLLLFEGLQSPMADLVSLHTTMKEFGTYSQKVLDLITAGESRDAIVQGDSGHIELLGVTVRCKDANKAVMRTVLEDVTMSVRPGEILGVSGPVASGKSTLLRAIAGEAEVSVGTVKLGGRVVYLPHEPWIVSDTLLRNVVMSEEFSPTKYRTAVALCQLAEDIRQLKDGEQTVIGSRGATLSGGQKQRIALARAIYAEPDILLLDDCLSQLDPQVAATVFDSVIMKHLSAKTRVFATNNPSWLAKLDRVAAIRDGRLAGAVSSGLGPAPVSSNVRSQHADIKDDAAAADIPTKDETAGISFRHWKPIIKALFTPRSKVFLLLLVIGISVVSIFVGEIHDRWLISEYRRSLGSYLVSYSALALFVAGTRMAISYLSNRYEASALSQLHSDMTVRVLSAPLSWHYSHETGTISTKLTSSYILVIYLFSDIIVFAAELGSFFLSLYRIVQAVPEYFLCLLAIVLAFWFLFSMFQPFQDATVLLWDRFEEERGTKLQELLDGLQTMQTPGNSILQTWAKHRVYQKHDRLMAVSLAKLMTDAWQRLRWVALMIMVNAIVCTALFSRRNSTSPALVGVVFAYMEKVETNVDWLQSYIAMIKTYALSSARIFSFIFGAPVEAGMEVESNQEWHATDTAISAKNFSVRYRSELPCVVKDAEFEVKADEKVGIVGRTGCGKSTVLLGLLRVVEPDRGSKVLVAGLDVSLLPIRALRSWVCMIPQDPWLFSGSLRDNLLGPISHPEINRILRTLGLDSLLSPKLTGKESVLDVAVEGNGSNLSQGEKQLICVARAIARRPKVLLLDEATSGLDAKAEDAVMNAIKLELKGTAVMMIAHRMSTIKKLCTRIVKVEAGKVLDD